MGAISEHLIEQYRQLHLQIPNYGNSSEWLVPLISRLFCERKVNSVLDYGCGKSDIVNQLGIPVTAKYDPAIPEHSEPKRGFEGVICTDVLEHIPVDDLSVVMHDIQESGAQYYFFNVSVRPAAHTLPDGQNAHCTVRDELWWLDIFMAWFDEITVVLRRDKDDFSVICSLDRNPAVT